MQPCAYPRCQVLVKKGRCPTHSTEVEQRRGSAASRGYGPQWRAARLPFLAAYPLCGMRPGGRVPVMSLCYEQGRVTAATQVDHVVPHKGDPVLFWDQDGNWQSLCQTCGARKSQAGL